MRAGSNSPPWPRTKRPPHWPARACRLGPHGCIGVLPMMCVEIDMEYYPHQYLLNNSGQGSMCRCPFTDERGQRRNPVRSRHPIKEELPKGNPEFATGLFEAGEGVPTASPKVTAG